MYSDGILSVILKTQLEFEDDRKQHSPSAIHSLNDLYAIMPKVHGSNDIEACLVAVFNAMFGADTIEYKKSETIVIKIDDRLAVVDLETLKVLCKDDEKLEQMVTTAIANVTTIFHSDAKLNNELEKQMQDVLLSG
jgi:hypothetical protein